MSKKIELDKNFVKIALEVYEDLVSDGMIDLKYKFLIREIMQKLRGEEFIESHIKRGYEQFKAYYLSHPVTKLDKAAKCKEDDVFLDDIVSLLKYDIFRNKIRKILDDKDVYYRYYWFDQIIINEYSQKEKRRILIFESDIETIESTYQLTTKWFDMYQSVYNGSGGMVMLFLNAEEKHFFECFLNCIKKRNSGA